MAKNSEGSVVNSVVCQPVSCRMLVAIRQNMYLLCVLWPRVKVSQLSEASEIDFSSGIVKEETSSKSYSDALLQNACHRHCDLYSNTSANTML